MFNRVLLEFYCTVVCFLLDFFFRSRGGGRRRKSYVILMGGHAKCLLLMTRGEGGGQKSQKPAYVIHGCSLTRVAHILIEIEKTRKEV